MNKRKYYRQQVFMQKLLVSLGVCVVLGIHLCAQSPQEAKPSFDCAKATTQVEKMICEDSSGELQNLDRQLFESYQEIKAKLDKNGKKALLDSQKSWIKTRDRCESKECLKESLQSRIKELQSYAPHTSNEWLGTYSLQQNLYTGSFTIQKCDTNNVCEVKYEAILNKSEFNDMHICEEVSMKLKIKNHKAIAYYDGEEQCILKFNKNENGIIITEQKPKDCYMGCGVGTEIIINHLYHKE